MREELHYMDYSSFTFPCQSLFFLYIYQLMGNKLFLETNFFPKEINLLKLATFSSFPNRNLRQFCPEVSDQKNKQKSFFLFLIFSSFFEFIVVPRVKFSFNKPENVRSFHPQVLRIFKGILNFDNGFLVNYKT